MITNGSIKFTNPIDFNDPFDCYPNSWGNEIHQGELPHAVVDSCNYMLQKALSQIVGVTCFTPHNDRMLMWSHYASQHKGICIGFDTDILIKECDKNSHGSPVIHSLKKVIYTDERPCERDADKFIKKSTEWGYENEYRLISCAVKGTPQWGPGVWEIPEKSIKEVIFGARIPQEIQKELVRKIKQFRSDIKLKKAVLDSYTYKIIIEDLDLQPDIAPMTGSLIGPNGNIDF